MKKNILIQCQSLIYLYYALGSVYTKYPDKNFNIDVLSTNSNLISDDFIKKIKLSKYINNIYKYNYQPVSKINKKIKKAKKNWFNIFLFKKIYKPQIIRLLKANLQNNEYTDIVFSHETQENIITYLKFAYPEADFIAYGDGAGGITGSNDRTSNPFGEIFKYKFFEEIKPNEIIALAPAQNSNSLDLTGIPIKGINKEILLQLIKEDEKIQNEINVYTQEILEKYKNYENKILLLISQLDDPKFMMSEADRIQIYIDIINKYCEEKSLVILKLHPSSELNIFKEIQSKCSKNIEIIFIPQTLKVYPVEIFSELLDNISFIISFISSSSIGIEYLYGKKTTDAYDVIQKYPLKERINPFLNELQEIKKRLKEWDRKSLVYKTDIVPELIKFFEKYGTPKYKSEKKKLSLLQKIFSVTNVYSKYSKKKQIAILGLKIKL